MPLSCFRNAHRGSDVCDNEPIARRASAVKVHKMATLRRTITGSSSLVSSTASYRTCSNASIAQLPPCPHVHDPKIDALMMPAPQNDRPSHCLRLSFPRIYSNLVSDMKDVKGCRDWRSFAVFEDDDVDQKVSAVELGKKKAADFQRKLSMLEDF